MCRGQAAPLTTWSAGCRVAVVVLVGDGMVEAGQAMIDRALAEHRAGELSGVDAAKVKLFCTELQGRVVDRCLQLFGGYGYILEYSIARMYADAMVTRIYGGTSEVMKSIISKSLGL